MKRPFFVLTAFLLAAGAAAADTWADLSEWAAVGEAVSGPEESRPLSTLYLEWDYLGDWVRAELAGEPAGELPRRWARLHALRSGAAAVPDWRARRVSRGVCLLERLGLPPEEIAALCDSLRGRRLTPELPVVEGVLTGFLLERRGLPGCGAEGDPSARLIAALGDIPGWSLDRLKEGRNYAQLFFEAEREVERRRVSQLERVREFLERPGLLVSLKYGYHRIRDLESAAPPVRIGEKHWIYPDGIEVDWGSGRRYEVTALEVLHNPEQHLLQIKEPRSRLKLEHDGERIGAEFGEYELHGAYLLATDHMEMAIDGGRYRRDDDEIRIWWPESFFASNKSGLLMALLILIVIMILLANIQRQKRELARPIQVRRRPKT